MLKVIGASPGEIEQTLPAIGLAALHLTAADHVAIVFGPREQVIVWDPVRGLRETVRQSDAAVANSVQREAEATRAAVLVHGPIDAWAHRFPAQADLCRSESLSEVAMLCVPLIGRTVEHGTILVRRHTARPFDDGDVALLEGFADQALIAIENARVFTELERTNREVSEALEQQTAIAEVLEVISSSPNDLENVLGQVLAIAARLCESDTGLIWQENGGRYMVGASHGWTPEELVFLDTVEFLVDDCSSADRVANGETTRTDFDIEDLRANPERLTALIASVQGTAPSDDAGPPPTSPERRGDPPPPEAASTEPKDPAKPGLLIPTPRLIRSDADWDAYLEGITQWTS